MSYSSPPVDPLYNDERLDFYIPSYTSRSNLDDSMLYRTNSPDLFPDLPHSRSTVPEFPTQLDSAVSTVSYDESLELNFILSLVLDKEPLEDNNHLNTPVPYEAGSYMNPQQQEQTEIIALPSYEASQWHTIPQHQELEENNSLWNSYRFTNRRSYSLPLDNLIYSSPISPPQLFETPVPSSSRSLDYLQRGTVSPNYSPSNGPRSLPRRNETIQCMVCEKMLGRPQDLKRHMKTHTGEKLFHCGTCGRSFSRKDALRRHQNLPTTVKQCKGDKSQVKSPNSRYIVETPSRVNESNLGVSRSTPT